ncbi:DUF2911 domain-containing protein [Litoribacter ruber]|uniref:DUF2911 domain-containing protein n=1 Tax=Litoribacter ruber TaxID=702568 RepID=A0AAP2CIP2_9BACT|nr:MULTISPECIES: DUF2911 domain-containing protein [Litoribacter]MBS9524575.1 DUF2911 domain-containing protein [Litoribacter alkaliphilus]MBT0810265.1 DUF2911 domain-containing protein [Litoribacter ruber]
MKRKLALFVILLSMMGYASVNGQQIQMPQASPEATLSQKIGLTDVKIEYSRPSMKGRKIFGELVPYGKVWRTGANAATIITFSTDVKVEGRDLEKGSYAIYSIPEKEDWTIIFSKNTKLWGSIGYDQADDVFRFRVRPSKTANKYETMEINFVDMTDTGASVAMKWERTSVKFRIETEVDPIVMKQIQEMVIDQDPQNPGLYYQAANYYYTNKKDLNQALEWISKSVDNDPKYWTLHLKAKIENDLGKKEEARISARKSLEMAKEAKNDDYVTLNERLLRSIR